MPLSKKKRVQPTRETIVDSSFGMGPLIKALTVKQPKLEDTCPNIVKAAEYVRTHPFVEIPDGERTALPLSIIRASQRAVFYQPRKG